jgi:hypothetical protein
VKAILYTVFYLTNSISICTKETGNVANVAGLSPNYPFNQEVKLALPVEPVGAKTITKEVPLPLEQI